MENYILGTKLNNFGNKKVENIIENIKRKIGDELLLKERITIDDVEKVLEEKEMSAIGKLIIEKEISFLIDTYKKILTTSFLLSEKREDKENQLRNIINHFKRREKKVLIDKVLFKKMLKKGKDENEIKEIGNLFGEGISIGDSIMNIYIGLYKENKIGKKYLESIYVKNRENLDNYFVLKELDSIF